MADGFMFSQPIVLQEREQRTRQVAVVYFLSSMKAVRITSVLGKYREILRDRGVHSMLSTMVTGRLVVRKKA